MNFKEFATKNKIVFDGAMGTTIQAMNLPESSWSKDNNDASQRANELLCLTSPDTIRKIHSDYFAAGCDIVLTNTFGANAMVLAEYGLQSKVAELNTAAVQIARSAAEGFNNKYVGLSVGPGSKLPTLSQITYDDLRAAYVAQITAAAKAGIDVVMIETCQDLLQVKAAIAAAMDVNSALSLDLPIMASLTVEENGAMLVGSDMRCAAYTLSGYPLFSLGLNCGFGPDKMAAPFAELASAYTGRLYISPNAGIPVLKDGKFVYPMTAPEFAELTATIVAKYGLFAAGGCCGTNDSHMKALAAKVKQLPVALRDTQSINSTSYVCSAYSASALRQQPAPTLIGERANATGSKAFRDLLKADDYAAMANIAKGQQASSHIIDLSIALSGRDEAADMRAIVPTLNRELTLPLMIDSTSDIVLAEALKHITGKPVINSINFEDGGAKLHKILKLLKYFPAAVVALTIDETGMAQTKEDKLRIAERLYNVWTADYGYPESDLIIDFLTFSVASGDEGSRYAAVHTIEAIREFKARHPMVNTTLGVSNVSFGLSAHARTVLNAVFLDKAVKAGLDTAIVHAEKVLPISSISEEELALCSALLDGQSPQALDNFIAHFAGMKEAVIIETRALPPEEALAQKILRGDSSALEPLISALLNTYSAANILNEILLKAMKDVGVLFNEGKLLLPFVLKSAEVMRECSTLLEPYLKGESNTDKGVVVLATVRGDVHDIGKNLVDIILTGNGYRVINMGTKVSGEDIAKAAIEHKANAIGMSGLLVKSVEIMKENIELFSKQGIKAKILLGGAALSADYVAKECAHIMQGLVYYCKDAFAGVSAMNDSAAATIEQKENHAAADPFAGKNWSVSPFDGTMGGEFYGNSDVNTATLADILPFMHKKALFETRWGARSAEDMQTAEARLAQMLEQLAPIIKPSFVYGIYPVQVRGNELWVTKNHESIHFASFPVGAKGECFTQLYEVTAPHHAVLPLQAVSLGSEAVDYLQSHYKENHYEQYYQYHGLLVELTEALAAYTLEQASCELWGDDPNKIWRYSFGYPLCPDLEGNRALCELIGAERIGITLTENAQMEPVYSTCAMLSWHPASKY